MSKSAALIAAESKIDALEERLLKIESTPDPGLEILEESVKRIVTALEQRIVALEAKPAVAQVPQSRMVPPSGKKVKCGRCSRGKDAVYHIHSDVVLCFQGVTVEAV